MYILIHSLDDPPTDLEFAGFLMIERIHRLKVCIDGFCKLNILL